MENEIVIQVEGLKDQKSADKMVRKITKMPGVELVDVNVQAGRISVTGGDLDQLYIVDIIESMGYTAPHLQNIPSPCFFSNPVAVKTKPVYNKKEEAARFPNGFPFKIKGGCSMICDLHCHTRFSDGSMSIDDVIFYARRAGLSFLSITDHDTMEGVSRSVVLGNRYGLRVIPGVELTCIDLGRNREVHLLCYLPDKPDRLLGLMNKTLESRTVAGKEMIRKTMRFYPVTEEHVGRYAAGSKAIYVCHIMQALMDLGYDCQSHGELYRHLFHPNNGICLVQPEFPDVYDVLDQIHQAGGMAVMAHPTLYGSMDLLWELAERGNLEGVEVYCPQASSQERQGLVELAQQFDLLITGGSNFHGFLTSDAYPLATCSVREDQIYALFRRKKLLVGK